MAKILIIEDEIQLSDVYSFMLERKGYEVACAGDGLIGLTKAQEFGPDLILLDMMMPNLGGIGFLERYQKTPPPHARIIIMSNMQSPEHQARAIELGASRYEIKASLTPKQLIDIVGDTLQMTH